MKFLLRLLGIKARPHVVNVPALCGRRLSTGELVALLHGKTEDDTLKAVLQLLWMRREACDATAADEAWKGVDTRFHHGGRQALDDLLADLSRLIEAGETDDEMKKYFLKT